MKPTKLIALMIFLSGCDIALDVGIRTGDAVYGERMIGKSKITARDVPATQDSQTDLLGIYSSKNGEIDEN